MIVKKLMSLILGVSLIKAVSGASISNVFVERETSPTRYYPSSPPYGYTSAASPYYSQINALSGSVPVYTDLCVSPCVPGQTHNSPYATIPVIGSANEETNGYQYSYIVYDENTGDHKAQRELSDGAVVRGEYSFIQPDGYVRKVQYVADDLKGFNAVVKNYVPIALGDASQYEIKHNKHVPLCPDEKKASLKNPSAEELGDHLEKYTPEVEQHGQKHNNNEPGHELEIPFSHKHKHHQEHNASGKSHKEELEYSQERLKELKKILEKASGESIEHLDEESSKEKHKKSNKHQEKSEEVNQGNSDYRHKKSSSEESHDKHQEKNKKTSNEQSTEVFEDSVNNSPKKESKEEFSESSEDSKEDLIETYEKPKTESTVTLGSHKIKTKKVSKEKSSESESIEDSKETTNVHIKHKEAHDLAMSANKVFVPYYDVVRCLQASLRKSERGPAALSAASSPLTYLVLNKPC
ncbi:unnamed protein product [Arctia plantaginis]|uniref:Uncharacterized protein n=1 Tax=Arctia plantaginis TaxID=874455 RepID=A0A8S1ADZ3_ARCPL|nr:unnamed protein product [Arctia plantaginis]